MSIFENTTIFDFETTGLSPVNDQIIEVAAIRMRNGKCVGEFSIIINPQVDVPEFITNLTGITNEDVRNQPTLGEVLPFFLDFIGDSLLVAHNAAFDLAFLQAKKNQFGIGSEVHNSFLDTRTICIARFPYQSHKLEVMCKQLEIPLEGAHRALNDVRATGNLLYKLDKDFGGAMDFLNKLYYFKKYAAPEGTPTHAKLIAV